MIASRCLRCGGPLALRARFCTILALTCRVCGELHRQSVPPAVAAGLGVGGPA
jgi:hypothetical protein